MIELFCTISSASTHYYHTRTGIQSEGWLLQSGLMNATPHFRSRDQTFFPLNLYRRTAKVVEPHERSRLLLPHATVLGGRKMTPLSRTRQPPPLLSAHPHHHATTPMPLLRRLRLLASLLCLHHFPSTALLLPTRQALPPAQRACPTARLPTVAQSSYSLSPTALSHTT